MQTVSTADALRFERICRDFVQAGKPDGDTATGIGTLGEKMLHAVIKSYVCEDLSCHERTLSADSRMVADVYRNGHIYEVQTGGFFPLKKKIGWYLDNTDCHITVIHPLPAVKYLSWIDPDGSISPRRRCAGKKDPKSAAKEIYWLSDFVGNPRLSVQLMFLEIEEYRKRDGWGNGGKRGSHRYELLPTDLLDVYRYTSSADYRAAFPDLPDVFTSKEFAKRTHLRGRLLYNGLSLFVTLGGAVEDGKIGKAKRYKKA